MLMNAFLQTLFTIGLFYYFDISKGCDWCRVTGVVCGLTRIFCVKFNFMVSCIVSVALSPLLLTWLNVKWSHAQ